MIKTCKYSYFSAETILEKSFENAVFLNRKCLPALSRACDRKQFKVSSNRGGMSFFKLFSNYLQNRKRRD